MRVTLLTGSLLDDYYYGIFLYILLIARLRALLVSSPDHGSAGQSSNIGKSESQPTDRLVVKWILAVTWGKKHCKTAIGTPALRPGIMGGYNLQAQEQKKRR